MPFDGSGNYVPAAAPNFPAAGGAVISSTYYNAVINDLATALSMCLTRDNQGKPSAAQNWNGQNLTNVAAFSATSVAATTGTFTGALSGASIVLAAGATLTQFDADGTLAANSDTRGVTQKAVKTYVDSLITGVWQIKGSTDCSANPNYPAALKAGDAYAVTVAGKIGGAAGIVVEVGDVYVSSAANAGGTQAAVGASWFILEHNLQGALLTGNALSELTGVAATARANIGAAARTPQIQAVVSAAIVTPTFADDMVIVTAQAVALNLANPTGTALDGWVILVRIKDAGVAKAITYGAQYREVGVTKPATTVVGKTVYIGMIFNNADTKWDIVFVGQEV
jgi:hypothetical protein